MRPNTASRKSSSSSRASNSNSNPPTGHDPPLHERLENAFNETSGQQGLFGQNENPNSHYGDPIPAQFYGNGDWTDIGGYQNYQDPIPHRLEPPSQPHFPRGNNQSDSGPAQSDGYNDYHQAQPQRVNQVQTEPSSQFNSPRATNATDDLIQGVRSHKWDGFVPQTGWQSWNSLPPQTGGQLQPIQYPPYQQQMGWQGWSTPPGFYPQMGGPQLPDQYSTQQQINQPQMNQYSYQIGQSQPGYRQDQQNFPPPDQGSNSNRGTPNQVPQSMTGSSEQYHNTRELPPDQDLDGGVPPLPPTRPNASESYFRDQQGMDEPLTDWIVSRVSQSQPGPGISYPDWSPTQDFHHSASTTPNFYDRQGSNSQPGPSRPQRSSARDTFQPYHNPRGTDRNRRGMQFQNSQNFPIWSIAPAIERIDRDLNAPIVQDVDRNTSRIKESFNAWSKTSQINKELIEKLLLNKYRLSELLHHKCKPWDELSKKDKESWTIVHNWCKVGKEHLRVQILGAKMSMAANQFLDSSPNDPGCREALRLLYIFKEGRNRNWTMEDIVYGGPDRKHFTLPARNFLEAVRECQPRPPLQLVILISLGTGIRYSCLNYFFFRRS